MAKTSFILGLIGGIVGFFSGILALAVGGLAGVFGAEGAGTVSSLGWVAIVFSILAIISSVLIGSKRKLGGWLMIISGIAILICISLFGILPAVLLVIGGIVALSKKDKNKK